MTVRMVQYKWGGRFLWFEITSQCSECDLTTKILENMMDKEFEGKAVSFEVKPWRCVACAYYHGRWEEVLSVF